MKSPEGDRTSFIYGACDECVAKPHCMARRVYEEVVVEPANDEFASLLDDVNAAQTELIDGVEVSVNINKRWNGYRSRVGNNQSAFNRAVRVALLHLSEPALPLDPSFPAEQALLDAPELRHAGMEPDQITAAVDDIRKYGEQGICGAWELDTN